MNDRLSTQWLASLGTESIIYLHSHCTFWNKPNHLYSLHASMPVWRRVQLVQVTLKDKTVITVNKKLCSIIGSCEATCLKTCECQPVVVMCFVLSINRTVFLPELLPRPHSMSGHGPFPLLPLVHSKRNETCVSRRTKVCFFNPHQSFRACWHLHKQPKLSEQTSYDDETKPLWMSSPAAGVLFFSLPFSVPV